MVRRTLQALVLFVPAWPMLASIAPAQTPEDSFRRANEAYEQGRYEDAAEGYRSLLRYDIVDPILEYNLGNAEFRRGRLGPAILHYERARRLDPIDPDIAANLAYAREQCFDRVESPQSATIVQWVHALQNRLGPDRQAWGALVVLWLAVAVVAWCSARPGGWSATYGWALAALLLVLALALSSWYTTLERLEGRRAAVVLADAVDVLAGPGPNNPALFTVHEGLTLEIRAERDEWLQVSLPNGLHGWISKEALEEV